MKTRSIVGVGLVIGLGVATSTTLSQDPPEIKTIADADGTLYALALRVATLEARVEALESHHEDSGPSVVDTPLAAAPSGTPVMRIESVETLEPDEATMMRVDQLGVDADALEQKAADLLTEASSITIDRQYGANDGTRQANRRRKDLLQHDAGEAKRQARQKRDEIKDLTAPRQIIRGWTGKKSVELRTERDLSNTLGKLTIGSFITCTGTRIDADDDSATLVVTSITPVAAPASFIERPSTSDE